MCVFAFDGGLRCSCVINAGNKPGQRFLFSSSFAVLIDGDLLMAGNLGNKQLNVLIS